MSEREWRFYIDDMIDFAEHVLAYCQGLDQAGLVGMINCLNGLGLPLVSVEYLPSPVEDEPSQTGDA